MATLLVAAQRPFEKQRDFHINTSSGTGLYLNLQGAGEQKNRAGFQQQRLTGSDKLEAASVRRMLTS